MATFDLTDALGRNFAFLSETTNARTALVVIDYGDGTVDRFRVATNVDRDPVTSEPVGISMGEVMKDILQLDYATQERMRNGQPTGVNVLTRVKTVVVDPGPNRFWVIIGTEDRHVAPNLSFDDIVVKSGDHLRSAALTTIV